MKLAAVFMALAGPVLAHEVNDLNLVMQENRDKVVTTTDASGAEVQTLDLGTVVVTCTADECIGTDKEAGSVGCAWEVVTVMRAVGEVCSLPEGQRAGLDAAYSRIRDFVADNTVPPLSPEKLDESYREQIEMLRTGGENGGPIDCRMITAPETGLMEVLESYAVAGSGENDTLDRLLATPRLPVMYPCE